MGMRVLPRLGGFCFLAGMGVVRTSPSDAGSETFVRFIGGFGDGAGLLEEDTAVDPPCFIHGKVLGMAKGLPGRKSSKGEEVS